jgi:hypothetical protein
MQGILPSTAHRGRRAVLDRSGSMHLRWSGRAVLRPLLFCSGCASIDLALLRMLLAEVAAWGRHEAAGCWARGNAPVFVLLGV